MAIAGKILSLSKGNWTSGSDYNILDSVYYNGSTYVAKSDIVNSTINPSSDTNNWQISARGFASDMLSELSAIDAMGLLGVVNEIVNSQDLINEISNRVITKLLPIENVVNSQSINTPGFALDARQANSSINGSLAYNLSQTSDNLNNKTIISSGLSLSWGTVSLGGYSIVGSLVVVNVRITTSQALTAGTSYSVDGFPLPILTSSSWISASCNLASVITNIFVNNSGVIQLVPAAQITSGTSLLLSAFYIKQ